MIRHKHKRCLRGAEKASTVSLANNSEKDVHLDVIREV